LIKGLLLKYQVDNPGTHRKRKIGLGAMLSMNRE
jgi:hypothetical protein